MRRRSCRGGLGLTLIEVLLVVAILLIGVYTVAAVFPLLQRQINRQGQLSQAAQMSQAKLTDWFAGTQNALLGIVESPSVVTGSAVYRTGSVSPNSDDPNTGYEFVPTDPLAGIPVDPTAPPSWAPAVRNAIKDLRDVIGEQAVIAPPTAALPGFPTLCAYLLRMGPAQPETITVWERVEYTRGRLGALAPGQFAVDPTTGDIETNPLPGTVDSAGNGFIVADYTWMDTSGALGIPNMSYGFQDEVIPVSVTFGLATGRPAPLAMGYGGSISPGATTVWGLRPFLRDAQGNNNGVIDPGEYDLSPTPPAVDPLGIVIYFNTLDAGRTVQVSYRVRDWSILWEDHTVPLFEPFGIRLSSIPLWVPDPGNPIPEKDDLFGGTGGVGELVAAYDMTVGAYLTDQGMLAPPPGDEDRLYERGQVTLPSSLAGHKLRFYYRARDNQAVQFICAQHSYVPLGNPGSPLVSHMIPPGGVEPLDLDEGRGYVLQQAGNVPALGVDPTISPQAWVLLFAPSEAGKTVAITYTHPDASGAPVREHTFADISTVGITYQNATWHYAVLGPRHPSTPLTLWAINSVNGVSVKARIWWTDDKGRYMYVDADGLASQ